MNSNRLEDKLKEILLHRFEAQYGTLNDAEVAQIIACFKEAGWSPPFEPTATSVDYEERLKAQFRQYMTGQEWYDRFEKLLIEIDLEDQWQSVAEEKILTAAKRAAGLDKQ